MKNRIVSKIVTGVVVIGMALNVAACSEKEAKQPEVSTVAQAAQDFTGELHRDY